MSLDFILIIIGFIILIKGSDLLVKAATSVANKFRLSEMLIGLTILAIGTSLPEIFITIKSSLDIHSELIIGDAIGSCICNFLLVIGISSFITPVKLDKRVVNRHLPIAMLIIVIILYLGNLGKQINEITRWQGAFLLLCAVIYIIYSIYEEKVIYNKKIEDKIAKSVKTKEEYSTKKIIIFFILGILGLKFGADFVVDNSILIASKLGLTERFIGMTIVAIGTSLPEIITSIISARKKETELLVGNVIGSNIINLCVLIGLGAIINPLTFISDFNIPIIILLLTTIFIQLIALFNKRNEINWKIGIILIVSYIVYIINII